jgi:hypothetical protein
MRSRSPVFHAVHQQTAFVACGISVGDMAREKVRWLRSCSKYSSGLAKSARDTAGTNNTICHWHTWLHGLL